MDDDGKVALVTLFCMLFLAFTSAFKGYGINPIALGAPAYMFLLRLILDIRCPVLNSSLIIAAVTAAVYVSYVV
ncbi:MAG: hypothetical protein B6U72_05960 [Candidatus Altiarchaeales archaeon ex4484_2]|nr:MAG: hypothetical protein B6U72_05960 [Candidatus Altiarchaeales archaeon ex4484_2]